MRKKASKTIICIPYDLNDLYCFWCRNYKDISMKEFLKIPASEFQIKIGSIPENDPLYKIVQSRVINLAEIKNKDERKYWSKLKRINKIPNEYLSEEEIMSNLKKEMGRIKI